MRVLRQTNIETEEFQIGDQIKVNLKDYGEFTLTAQKVTEEGTLFIFNSIVTKRQMNSEWTNKGGFENSELNKWMQSELLDSFPESIKSRIKSISIPTYEQIVGHDDFESYFELYDDDQFPLMKNEKNRVSTFEDETCGYWLKNATKKEVSSAHFAFVYLRGNANAYNASVSDGVLPVILLR